MYGRFSYFQGSKDKIDETARFVHNNTGISRLPKFQHAYFFANRSSGKALTITLWETEKGMDYSDDKAVSMRSLIAEKLGAPEPATVSVLELVEEIGQVPSEKLKGSFARIIHYEGKGNSIDEAVQLSRNLFSSGSPRGLRKALDFSDRNQGKFVVVALWDSEANMRASAQWASSALAQVNDKLGNIYKPVVEEYELLEEMTPGPTVKLRP